MKPVKFKHQNVVYAENQPEYIPLPALRLNTTEAEVISCWKLSFKERVKVIFTGIVWVSMASFNKPIMPLFLSISRKNVYSHLDDNVSFLKKIKMVFIKRIKEWGN